MSVTPNMNMTLPTVSVTLGPTYATQQNEALDVVDAHDHTSGKGVRVPASGIDVNADLPFGSNAATGLGSAQFTSQTVALTGIESALYFLDGDLYAIDGDGNAIQMTVGGVIASGIVGNISGLVAPATAAYAASTFTWKSTATTYATMVSGPLVVRRGDEASPQYVALLPPPSLASSYEMRFPAAIPASTQFLTLDASGGIAAGIATSQGITKAMQAAVGQQVSSVATQTVSAPAGAWTSVTNAVITSMSITGRPVMLTCIADPALGTSSGAYFQAELSYTDYGAGLGAISGSTIGMRVSITGSATTTVGQTILQQQFSVPSAITAPLSTYTVYPPSAFSTVYVPAGAGTFTFQLQLYGSGTLDVSCANIRLLAYEL